jgi:tRNA pseudouridine55 synthase
MAHGYPRKRRVDELLKQEIAAVLSKELKDPRMGFATVMAVKSAPDLRTARVYVSVLGSEEEKQTSLAVLCGAAGFVRARVGNAVTLKYVPELRFELDRTLEEAARIETILGGLHPGDSETDLGDASEPVGILLIDKPAGLTSHDAVQVVRRATKMRRVGHFGTLDPFATGLLVCAIGPATRLAVFCSGHDKTYEVTVRLGWRSTTDDSEGELSVTEDVVTPSREMIDEVCQAWQGHVAQAPPAYSAKHVGGKRAYQRARAGETVTLPEVEVTIHSVTIESYAFPELALTVECGGGTYMRALARDIGEALGTGGYCAALRRTRSGPFTVEAAIGWDLLSEPDLVREAIQPTATAIAELPVVELSEPQQTAVVHGQTIGDLDSNVDAEGWVQLHGPRGFVGLGELHRDPHGWQLSPRRILYPDGEGR